jgi:hypothetical protein
MWTLAIALGEENMAVPAEGKHKRYARYAAHCLQMVPPIIDQEYRAVQREMAVEWLKLADAILHSSRRQQIQMR